MRPSLRFAAIPALALTFTSCDSSTGPGTQALVDFVLGFCASDAPAFVAYQNEGGAWTPVTLSTSSSTTIKVTSKLGIAIVNQFGSSFETEVVYGTTAELATVASNPSCGSSSGSKTLNGSVSGLTSGQFADITMSRISAFVFAGGATSFQLFGVPDGAQDLVAMRSTNGIPNRTIVRRALNLTTSATIPVLDFGAAEAVVPATNTLTISGHSPNDFNSVSIMFRTATGTETFFSAPSVGTTSATIYGIPASLTLTTDMHQTDFFSAAAAGTSARGVIAFNRNLTDRSMALGAALNTPTITTFSTSPILMRAQFATQADYNSLASVQFEQVISSASRSFSVMMTSGYNGSTAISWDLPMPNLTGVAGFPSGASLVSGTTDWFVVGTDGSPAAFFGSGTEGTLAHYALRGSSSGSFLLEENSSALRADRIRVSPFRRLADKH